MFQKVKQTVTMWWWLRAFCWLVVEHSSTFYWSWPKTITRWDDIPICSLSYLADKVWLNSILLKYKIVNTYCRGSMNLGWSSASRTGVYVPLFSARWLPVPTYFSTLACHPIFPLTYGYFPLDLDFCTSVI